MHHPRKCHDLVGLTEYLEKDLCIDMADELADYMKMDHVIGKLRGFLKSGPQQVFDENIKEWNQELSSTPIMRIHERQQHKQQSNIHNFCY